MGTSTVAELRKKADAAFADLTRQLQGMEPYLERADAPGEWTTREVLSHLLEADDWKPAAVLASFAERDLPTIEIAPGETYLTPKRRAMTLKQFVDALDAQ